jgi:hypothetical protein
MRKMKKENGSLQIEISEYVGVELEVLGEIENEQ